MASRHHGFCGRSSRSRRGGGGGVVVVVVGVGVVVVRATRIFDDPSISGQSRFRSMHMLPGPAFCVASMVAYAKIARAEFRAFLCFHDVRSVS